MIIIPATSLPALSNPGAAADLKNGKQLIDANGNVLTGTMPNITLPIPGITVSSGGLITASYEAEAGYSAGGSKSGTKQLTTQAGTTITPGTSQKTAVASGRYTTGPVYVAGDSDLKAENIKDGVNIFGVTGTYGDGMMQVVAVGFDTNYEPVEPYTTRYHDSSNYYVYRLNYNNNFQLTSEQLNWYVCGYAFLFNNIFITSGIGIDEKYRIYAIGDYVTWSGFNIPDFTTSYVEVELGQSFVEEDLASYDGSVSIDSGSWMMLTSMPLWPE